MKPVLNAIKISVGRLSLNMRRSGKVVRIATKFTVLFTIRCWSYAIVIYVSVVTPNRILRQVRRAGQLAIAIMTAVYLKGPASVEAATQLCTGRISMTIYDIKI
jgi:hypothetical protein